MNLFLCVFFSFFIQTTAYEKRISDWSSDVCSSDLVESAELDALLVQRRQEHPALVQGQPDKPASKFQGVFSIHFWVSGISGHKAQRHVVPIKRMQTGKISV